MGSRLRVANHSPDALAFAFDLGGAALSDESFDWTIFPCGLPAGRDVMEAAGPLRLDQLMQNVDVYLHLGAMCAWQDAQHKRTSRHP
jgi:hypothetical protein